MNGTMQASYMGEKNTDFETINICFFLVNMWLLPECVIQNAKTRTREIVL